MLWAAVYFIQDGTFQVPEQATQTFAAIAFYAANFDVIFYVFAGYYYQITIMRAR